jgi:hypothetical protein
MEIEPPWSSTLTPCILKHFPDLEEIRGRASKVTTDEFPSSVSLCILHRSGQKPSDVMGCVSSLKLNLFR